MIVINFITGISRVASFNPTEWREAAPLILCGASRDICNHVACPFDGTKCREMLFYRLWCVFNGVKRWRSAVTGCSHEEENDDSERHRKVTLHGSPLTSQDRFDLCKFLFAEIQFFQ